MRRNMYIDKNGTGGLKSLKGNEMTSRRGASVRYFADFGA
jgi:hypothetical protein